MIQVREALCYIIDLLNENDRLCLITFESVSERILPFTRVTA